MAFSEPMSSARNLPECGLDLQPPPRPLVWIARSTAGGRAGIAPCAAGNPFQSLDE